MSVDPFEDRGYQRLTLWTWWYEGEDMCRRGGHEVSTGTNWTNLKVIAFRLRVYPTARQIHDTSVTRITCVFTG